MAPPGPHSSFGDKVSLHSPGCPRTHYPKGPAWIQRPTCLCFPSAEIKGGQHQAQTTYWPFNVFSHTIISWKPRFWLLALYTFKGGEVFSMHPHPNPQPIPRASTNQPSYHRVTNRSIGANNWGDRSLLLTVYVEAQVGYQPTKTNHTPEKGHRQL